MKRSPSSVSGGSEPSGAAKKKAAKKISRKEVKATNAAAATERDRALRESLSKRITQLRNAAAGTAKTDAGGQAQAARVPVYYVGYHSAARSARRGLLPFAP